ncbi:MAG: EAL domain-containing protein [Actinobacteria bacterium]|nr:EAL domain-containing protein [Actinomycetota bacterium]
MPRYISIIGLAAGVVLGSDSPAIFGLYVALAGTAVNLLIHRHAVRTGQPPAWMPFADLATCLVFAFAEPELYIPSALVGLAVVTLTAIVFGPNLSLLIVGLGAAGFVGAAHVHEMSSAVGTIFGFAASGTMIAVTVGRLSVAGSAANERLDHVVDHIDAILWIFQPGESRFTFANKRAESALGWDVSRWGEVSFWREHVHPDDRDHTFEAFTRALTTATDQQIDYRFRAATGEWRHLRDQVTVVKDEAGRVTALHGMSQDVTDRILIEQRVNRYADIVHRIDQALVVVQLDAEERLVLSGANPASEELLQRPLGQLLGSPISEVFATTAGAVMEERLRNVVVTGRPLEVDGIVVTGPAGVSRVITLRAFPLPDRAAAVSLLDVTAAEAAAEALRRQALYDELTGLPNRRVLDDELQRAVREVPASGERIALLMMDLDQFKEVNDALGHHVGDQLLHRIGDRLASVIDDALIARLGGDEFAVLLVGMIDPDDAWRTAERIRDALAQPFLVDDIRLQSNASIGIALYPDQAFDAPSLIQRADVAMYNAKRSGKGIALYAPEDDRSSVTRLTLISDLPDAVAAGQLELHYQPFVDLRTGRIVRAEALVRWRHPTWGLLQPQEFVELAGVTGAIQPLTRWVLEEGTRCVREWGERGHPIGLAVNLSARNLYDPGLVEYLGLLLERAGIDPYQLVVELTETELMDDASLARDVFESLRALGVQTAIDDFGTGYSSMTFLRDLPLQEIKVDRSFVQHMHERSDEFTIVRSMIDLGHNLGLEVVAEGVERPDQVELLQRLGCDLAQGYHWSRPLPSDDLMAWMEAAGSQVGGAMQATRAGEP